MNKVLELEICVLCDNKAKIGDLCNVCWQDLEVKDYDEDDKDKDG